MKFFKTTIALAVGLSMYCGTTYAANDVHVHNCATKDHNLDIEAELDKIKSSFLSGDYQFSALARMLPPEIANSRNLLMACPYSEHDPFMWTPHKRKTYMIPGGMTKTVNCATKFPWGGDECNVRTYYTSIAALGQMQSVSSFLSELGPNTLFGKIKDLLVGEAVEELTGGFVAKTCRNLYYGQFFTKDSKKISHLQKYKNDSHNLFFPEDSKDGVEVIKGSDCNSLSLASQFCRTYDGQQIPIKTTYAGNYISAPATGTNLGLDTTIGDEEMFTVECLQNNKEVRFITNTGKYLSVSSGKLIQSDTAQPGTNEQFSVSFRENGFEIQDQNDQYIATKTSGYPFLTQNQPANVFASFSSPEKAQFASQDGRLTNYSNPALHISRGVASVEIARRTNGNDFDPDHNRVYWGFMDAGNATFNLLSAQDGKFLSMNMYGNLYTKDFNDNWATWKFIPTHIDGYYRIQNAAISSYYLHINNGYVKASANVPEDDMSSYWNIEDLIKFNANSLSLTFQTENGNYLSAEPPVFADPLTPNVRVDSTVRGVSESFLIKSESLLDGCIESGDTVMVRTAHGAVIEEGSLGSILANTLAWEVPTDGIDDNALIFKIRMTNDANNNACIDDGDSIALETNSGAYLTSADGGYVMTSANIGSHEQFLVEAGTPYNFVDHTNIAVGKTASLSSEHEMWPASNAVDGIRDGDFAHNANPAAGEWWQVDLGDVYNISQSYWYNRSDSCCSQRMRDYTIQTSLDGNTWIDASHQTTEMGYPTQVDINTTARYVRLRQNINEIINFEEAEIMGRLVAPQSSDDGVSFGKVIVNQDTAGKWTPVTFAQEFTQAPIVVAGPMVKVDNESAIVTVRNVTTQGFEIQVREWDYLDGIHNEATLDYMAIEPGSHYIGGLQIEAASITVDENFTPLNFTNAFTSTPSVFSQLQMGSAVYQSATPRMRNVSTHSVDVMLQEQESHDGDHWYERVNVIAIQQGRGTLGGKAVQVGKLVTGNTKKTVNFAEDITASSLFSSIETMNGGDTASVLRTGLTSSNAELKVREEKSLDTEMSHVNETLSWMVIGQ